MAINQYDITDSGSTHLSTLKGVLEEVATAYFDKYELSEDGLTLDCYSGTKKLLSFRRRTMTYGFGITVYGNNVNSSVDNYYWGSDVMSYIYKIITTKNGIALCLNDNNVKRAVIFISKTQNGKTGVVYFNNKFSLSSNKYGVNCVAEDSVDIGECFNYYANKPETTICPLVVSGTTDYFPNLFAVPTCPYTGTESILSVGGINYLYNGYIALKDE